MKRRKAMYWMEIGMYAAALGAAVLVYARFHG